MSDVRHERRFRDFRGTFRLPSKTRRESGHSGSAAPCQKWLDQSINRTPLVDHLAGAQKE